MSIESICVGLVAIVAGLVCLAGGFFEIPILSNVLIGKRMGFAAASEGEEGSRSAGRWRMIVLGVVFLLLGLSFVLGLRFPWQ